MKAFKEKLLEKCEVILREKMNVIVSAMNEMNASMENETKSSLGDKHETARARMQAEQEKLSFQLEELKMQFDFLQRMDFQKTSKTVSNQSLVITNQGLFFIAIPLGKIDLEGKTVFVISSKSPLGQKLFGLSANGSFNLNGTEYVVKEIF